ncbi:MAG: heavy-metal-associated domain-containing protein [Mycolicibacterium rufum]|uniref:Copper chaperone CopZ n=1 Tax=Mycolicibacterium chlorophenolicum TaxID=37916 RepID=A0A0J6VTR8_9MYCO|nr:heavy metal-associated domain-containing protein [Mycolicibacterium chlorophenolicum]KMO72872.1 Copper chaperone CopZ [Mycolicibacterium chlorophenolicum]MBI5340882.1 heavy-metal-associated domain-containing protein [Mycolicibacterium rufum]
MNTAPTTYSYAVDGLTCAHCVSAVSAELSALPGVEAVAVELVPGGVSTVTLTTDTPPAPQEIAAALDDAGDYRLLAGPEPR